MLTEYDFFLIDKSHLKGKKTFPFQLYVFNPLHKKYSLVLNGNRPLTKELDEFINYLLEKGGKLAILRNQRRTFLVAQEATVAEVPSLQEKELHPLEKERIMHIKLKEMYLEKNPGFSLQSAFETACETNDFNTIVDHARIDILTFSVTHSPTVSLALHMAKTFLEGDTHINRIVAVSYHLAKTMNIKDEAALSDIVCAAYLSHIGLTQIPLSYSRTPYLTLNEKEKSLFQKHTILGVHLIKKSHVDLSERCKRTILDHHEQVNGGGYPSMKNGDSIEQFAQIIGGISHLFEMSSSKINSASTSLKSIIYTMKGKNFMPGLQIDFDERVFEAITTLINTENDENRKAA
jgi:HD-GYP domain-containing protein (c-di-GMP phosphodiesterase class II)